MRPITRTLASSTSAWLCTNHERWKQTGNRQKAQRRSLELDWELCILVYTHRHTPTGLDQIHLKDTVSPGGNVSSKNKLKFLHFQLWLCNLYQLHVHGFSWCQRLIMPTFPSPAVLAFSSCCLECPHPILHIQVLTILQGLVPVLPSARGSSFTSTLSVLSVSLLRRRSLPACIRVIWVLLIPPARYL